MLDRVQVFFSSFHTLVLLHSFRSVKRFELTLHLLFKNLGGNIKQEGFNIYYITSCHEYYSYHEVCNRAHAKVTTFLPY